VRLPGLNLSDITERPTVTGTNISSVVDSSNIVDAPRTSPAAKFRGHELRLRDKSTSPARFAIAVPRGPTTYVSFTFHGQAATSSTFSRSSPLVLSDDPQYSCGHGYSGAYTP
jgi:hypothetical protein